MHLTITYSGSLKSGAFVEIKGETTSAELAGVLSDLDEQVDLQEPFNPELEGLGGLFAGDPSFGANIDVVPNEGSDPTD